MTTSVLWFRRDLRLADHPALLRAARADRVLPLFVLDDALRRPSGAPRLAYLWRTLRALDEALEGRLVVRAGSPAEVVPAAAAEVEADEVHVSADTGPYGRRRDAAVAEALEAADRRLVRTGSPYLVGPGTVRKGDGTPFRVFTPFFRAWRQEGWARPAETPSVGWLDGVASEGVPDEPDLGSTVLPEAGEAAGRAAWDAFREERLGDYPEHRNSPARPGTSRLSPHLKYGTLHPRTLAADVGPPSRWTKGAEAFVRELAFRDFYADVLWHEPRAAREALRPEMAAMRWDTGPTAEERFRAWQEGRTGFPFVDAGMRQLAAEAWMHNRVRMVVASFLIKDLHVDWRRGARHFMQALADGDLSNNNQGWQWVAGSGTDAAPFFRVFNPVTQGEKFDPDGDYVRRFVPELRDVPGKAVHQPWRLPGGLPDGYPEQVVDHGEERREALARYAEVRG